MKAAGNRKFIEWLTNRYEMIIRNEADFAEKRTFKFTYAKLFSIMFIAFAVTMGVSLFVGKYLLREWFNPDTEIKQLRLEVIQYGNQVDSLKMLADRSLKVYDRAQYAFDPDYTLSEAKSVEDQSFEELGDEQALSLNTSLEPISQTSKGLYLNKVFYSPTVDGELISKFDFDEEKYGVVIKVPPGDLISAIEDGEIIASGWDKSDGFYLVVQHTKEMISIYRKNSVLLKKVGTFVSAGEVVAMAGDNSSEASVELQLWINGSPVDPADHIRL